jgi:hypothetical protein
MSASRSAVVTSRRMRSRTATVCSSCALPIHDSISLPYWSRRIATPSLWRADSLIDTLETKLYKSVSATRLPAIWSYGKSYRSTTLVNLHCFDGLNRE